VSPPVCRRLPGADGSVVAAVDAGRVVAITRRGVRLLSTNGAVIGQWTLPSDVVHERLRGRTLVVQTGSALVVYDASTGAQLGKHPLAAGEGPAALLDVG